MLQIAFYSLAVIGLFVLFNTKNYFLVITGLIIAFLTWQRIRTEYYFILFAAIGIAAIAPNSIKYTLIIVVATLFFSFSYGALN